MNLWDIKAGKYNEKLMTLASGSSDTSDLEHKLGHVHEDGGGSFGNISTYFVERYGFNSNCSIVPFTGDNPSTILALPLRPLDAMVSLGTSTTFLMSTPHYSKFTFKALVLQSLPRFESHECCDSKQCLLTPSTCLATQYSASESTS